MRNADSRVLGLLHRMCMNILIADVNSLSCQLVVMSFSSDTPHN
jgi:hypothetical protein